MKLKLLGRAIKIGFLLVASAGAGEMALYLHPPLYLLGLALPRVHLTMIDKLIDELKLDRIDFVKMDIEGAPDRALTGARQSLLNYKPRLAVSTKEDNDDPGRIINIIDDLYLG